MTTVREGDVTLHGGDHDHPLTVHSLFEELRQQEYDVIAVEQPAANLEVFIEDSPYRYDGRDLRLAYSYAEKYDVPLAAIDADSADTIPSETTERGDRLANAALLTAAGVTPANVKTRDETVAEIVLSLSLSELRDARCLYRNDDSELFNLLVDHRDRIMASSLRGLQNKGYNDILAVIGQSHVAGVADYLSQQEDIQMPTLFTP